MSKNVIIVGGGIAGLAASIFLARAGRSVTIFEKRRILGGRAVTHLRQGYRFNLGPHALYRRGAGATVLRQLGIPMRGGTPPSAGVALRDGKRHRFPGTIASLLITDLLPIKAKVEAASLLARVNRIKVAPLAAMSFRDWLDSRVAHPEVRQFVEAIGRLATYSDHPELQSAATVVGQIQIATRGVLYLDEGWQKLVDSLHSSAISAGVSFVTSSRVVAIDHDGQSVRGVELGG
ncbi:MAG TPA: FAD-dependent oxidoreductase, partial [Thermoanaerobaculia bacterium]|nr:FAD-dependent oxidoreductase [Thermoanaerobaculia bacterium]